MEIITFRSSTPASAPLKQSTVNDEDEKKNDVQASDVVAHISAYELPRILAPIEHGLLKDQSMLHVRSNGEELIISAKDLRQAAGDRTNRAETSYETIIQMSSDAAPQGSSKIEKTKNSTFATEKTYASIPNESYATIAVKALNCHSCNCSVRTVAFIIAFILILGIIAAIGIFFNRHLLFLFQSPPAPPIPSVQTFINFSLSAKRVGETIIMPKFIGSIPVNPPLAYIDQGNKQVAFSFTLGSIRHDDVTRSENVFVITANENGETVNRKVNYKFNYYGKYWTLLQCFDVSGNPSITAYCCINRAIQLNNASFIQCTGPNESGEIKSNYELLYGRMIMVDWVKHKEQLVLVYLIVSDHMTLVLHPEQHIKVPFSDKILQVAASNKVLGVQVFINSATKFKQSDLTFSVLQLVRSAEPPCHYICSYQLNLEKYDVTELNCTAIPALFELIRSLEYEPVITNGNRIHNEPQPDAFVDIATSPSSETIYLIHVPSEFPEFFPSSNRFGYKHIAAFSAHGTFIGIDSLPYEFPRFPPHPFVEVINNIFVGNLNFCFSSAGICNSSEIPEKKDDQDRERNCTLQSALNIYRYAANICMYDDGKCFELTF